MTLSVLIGQDEVVKKWVSERVGGINFGLSVAMGFVENDNIVIGVVYNNYFRSVLDTPISIEISLASDGTKRCNRAVLKTIFAYPFIQLGVKRVQATCSESNADLRKFLEHAGFKFESIAREAWRFGGNSAVYSMLKHECKWIKNVI